MVGWIRFESAKPPALITVQSSGYLLDQGYNKIRLIRSLKKFIFWYQDLVEIYSVSAETIINDALKHQTSRSHYGSKSPAVTITVFKYRNKLGKIVVKTVPYSVNVNVKNTFTSHIDNTIILTFFLTSLSLSYYNLW
jgi:hypothetical protein